MATYVHYAGMVYFHTQYRPTGSDITPTPFPGPKVLLTHRATAPGQLQVTDLANKNHAFVAHHIPGHKWMYTKCW